MTAPYLEKALHAAIDAASAAAPALRAHFGSATPLRKSETGNSATDMVTELDRSTEKDLHRALSSFDPAVAFQGEEHGLVPARGTGNGLCWLADPIDGTVDYVRGLPFCTTMLALADTSQPVPQVLVSVIHDFVRQDTYWAVRGQDAFRDGEALRVSSRSLSQAMICFETRLEDPDPRYLMTYQAVLRTGMLPFHALNSGWLFSMTASGRLEGKIGLCPYGQDWDYAPGSLLVCEAGGISANIGSTSYDYRDHDLIITNEAVYHGLTEGSEAIFPRRK